MIPDSPSSSPLTVVDYKSPTTPGINWRQGDPLTSRQWFSIIAQFALMLSIIISSLLYGLDLRVRAWFATEQIHFRTTMHSAILWGQRANQQNAQDVYQQMVAEFGEEQRYRGLRGALPLDYPPLRLIVIARWEKWTENEFPLRPGQQANWNPRYEYTRPMLWLNNACEIGGALGMFLVVHYWLRRCKGAPLQPWLDPICGCWPALLAALLLWFNPAVIFNAHCYPQWDVWILPFFLFAVYLGLQDWWLCAGICIGIVAMGKGQILLVTPALMIWQLCIGRPSAILRMVIGIALASGVIASKWLVNNDPSFEWMFLVLIAAIVGSLLFFYRGWTLESLIIHSVAGLVFAGLVLRPWLQKNPPPYFKPAIGAVLCSIILARFIPRRRILTWIAGNFAMALFACAPSFNTSMDWYTVGIKGPTHNWQLLYWCQAMNLGAILQENYGWEWHEDINLDDYLPKIQIPKVSPDHVEFMQHPYTSLLQSLQHPWTFPMRYLMLGAFGITLVLCGIAMAMHYRRKSPMFFFAMVAPWMMMFTLLPQMQNRYLVWAAAFSAAAAAVSLDGFMLYLLLFPISIIDTAVDMMGYVRGRPMAEQWLPIIGPMFPGMSWGVLLIAGIWLYLALKPSRKIRAGVCRPGLT